MGEIFTWEYSQSIQFVVLLWTNIVLSILRRNELSQRDLYRLHFSDSDIAPLSKHINLQPLRNFFDNFLSRTFYHGVPLFANWIGPMSASPLTKSRGEREFPFPVIPKNGGLWFPFPNFGNGFFHSLPVPKIWEWIFSFPSRSRILGMDFFIPFPFPNFGNGNFSFPFCSRIDHFKVGNQKGIW